MGYSRCSSPLGVDLELQLDSDVVPARTPGTLGRLDAADPDTVSELGDTPTSLGVGDHGDPHTSRFTLGVPPLLEPFYEDSPKYKAFEGMVLERQVKRAEKKRKRAHDIPADELGVVEGKFMLRKKAAERCRTLLAKARADLKKEQDEFNKKSKKEQQEAEQAARKAKEVPVTKVKTIGISSAYRSPEYDEHLWKSYFRQKYYPATHAERSQLGCQDGGSHGWKAIEMMAKFVGKRKAAPGFSNHSNGIAVDFFTIEDKERLQAETGNSDKGLAKHNARWERSWLYKWLQKNKSAYNVERIETEAWHWEFHE